MSYGRFCYATVLLGVHLLAGGCSSDAPRTDNSNQAAEKFPTSAQPQEQGKLVLAFGDSLYAGYGLGPTDSFPAQLERALREQGIAASVHNAGVSGDTSGAGRQRLAFTMEGLRRKPDLAIVGLGGNDMLRGLDPSATKANLLAVCEDLRRRGIKVVLTGMVAAPNLGQDYSRRFNRIFPDVAERCGAELYPFFLEDVITRPDLMLPDGIHPNSSGIRRIVAGIQPIIARELRPRG